MNYFTATPNTDRMSTDNVVKTMFSDRNKRDKMAAFVLGYGKTLIRYSSVNVATPGIESLAISDNEDAAFFACS